MAVKSLGTTDTRTHISSDETQVLSYAAVQQPARKRGWFARRPAVRDADRERALIREINDGIDSVCPNYSQLSKSVRHFAGRYLSTETPHEAVIGVISAHGNEGRTTVALGLAAALAEIYSSVAMVEMESNDDQPTLCSELHLGAEHGLRDYIDGEASLDEIARPTEKRNLWLIPAGSVRAQSSRLDATARTRQLLDELRRTFDVVVVDMPPVLTSEETPALFPDLTGVVLIASAGSTTTDEVQHVLELCDSLPLKGVLLNRVRLRAPSWLTSLFRSGN